MVEIQNGFLTIENEHIVEVKEKNLVGAYIDTRSCGFIKIKDCEISATPRYFSNSEISSDYRIPSGE